MKSSYRSLPEGGGEGGRRRGKSTTNTRSEHSKVMKEGMNTIAQHL